MIEETGAALNRSLRYADEVKDWGHENQFGCYQLLCDLTLTFDAGPGLRGTSPSGHAKVCVNGQVRTVMAEAL